jgi:hypothetical protein
VCGVLFMFAWTNPKCFSRLLNEFVCKPEKKSDTWMDAAMRVVCKALTWVVCFVKQSILKRMPGGGGELARNLFVAQGDCATWFTSKFARERMAEFSYFVKFADPRVIFGEAEGVIATTVGTLGVTAMKAKAASTFMEHFGVAGAGALGKGAVALTAAIPYVAIGTALATVCGTVWIFARRVHIEQPFGCEQTVWLSLASSLALVFVDSPPAWIGKQKELAERVATKRFESAKARNDWLKEEGTKMMREYAEAKVHSASTSTAPKTPLMLKAPAKPKKDKCAGIGRGKAAGEWLRKNHPDKGGKATTEQVMRAVRCRSQK